MRNSTAISTLTEKCTGTKSKRRITAITNTAFVHFTFLFISFIFYILFLHSSFVFLL